MVQAVYDTLLTKNIYSKYFGQCMPGAMEVNKPLGEVPDQANPTYEIGPDAKKYIVRGVLKADSGAYKLVVKRGRNYVGFIAEGPPDDDGAVDVAIVFRGTITEGEWVQDAKAIKVCWNGGKDVAQPPDVFLTDYPFLGDIRVAFWAFIITQLPLNSELAMRLSNNASALLAGQHGGLRAASSGGITAALGSFIFSVMSLPGEMLRRLSDALIVFQEAVGATDGASVLGASGLTALVVFLVCGVAAGIIHNPGDWIKNVICLIRSCWYWSIYGTKILISGLFGPKEEPRVSYGFKEMYCDSSENPVGLIPIQKEVLGIFSTPDVLSIADVIERSNKFNHDQVKQAIDFLAEEGYVCPFDGHHWTRSAPPSPRSEVYMNLVDLLSDRKRNSLGLKPIRIKSITVTGHSLGGALASLCGFDLHAAISEAVQSAPAKRGGGQQNSVMTPLERMHDRTAEHREEFIEAIRMKKEERGLVPAVGVVTFAAPRVGDLTYANAFGGRTLMIPCAVAERLFDRNYQPQLWFNIPMIFRDGLPQVFKMPWYWVGLWQAAVKTPEKPTARIGMLRIVNTHDIVPNLPSTLPLPPLMYVHGGHELLLNSLYVCYFKASELSGATLGARHNLEMYLHVLNPTRDRALVNKGDDVLIDDCKLDSRWWDPVPNMGMKKGEKGKWEPPA